ncbi:RNA-binding S4 domain-containing protein [Rubellimicrobium aerolatum]|uniref:RNA-binding S4 domain-containing protein n=1 Tax=Rubellimicrobium aerolatum TaxID=490979 RepID=A0ABW0SEB4_9RHOB|nr:ribosome-associated heat shock protein Hsp15 [Rubellimicrobium aerolatum]
MTGEGPRPSNRPTIRLDKWLWQARFLKSRSLAANLVAEGRLRVNGQPTDKPARAVGAGDVLTFALHGRVRVVRILDLGDRRGPAPEAQALYEDLAPAPPPPPALESPGGPG